MLILQKNNQKRKCLQSITFLQTLIKNKHNPLRTTNEN